MDEPEYPWREHGVATEIPKKHEWLFREVAEEVPPATPIDIPSLKLPMLENPTIVDAPWLKHDVDMGMTLWLDAGDGHVGVNVKLLMRTLNDEKVREWIRRMMGGDLY